jgi:hypothetical protein
MMVSTGQRCPRAGLWTSTDPCRAQILMTSELRFPACGKCGNPVLWQLDRSTTPSRATAPESG